MAECRADLFGTPAQAYAWAEEDRHPGLVMPPGQAPAPLKQILDTSSIFPQDEPRASQGTGAYAASAPAGKPRQKRQPRCKDHQPAPDPFRYSSESLEDPPKTMQLWRDVVSLRCMPYEDGLLAVWCHMKVPTQDAAVPRMARDDQYQKIRIRRKHPPHA